jgi:hypothetical protein
MEKKKNLGLLSPEEQLVMQAQDEAKAAQYQEWTCRTRRSNKEINHK